MKRQKRRRLLIFNPYGIGDVLFSIPLLSALKERQNISHCAYVCNSRARAVLEGNPYVDEIITYDRDEIKKGLRKKLEFFRQLCNVHADLAIDLTLNRNLSFLLFLAGIRERVGLDYKSRGTFLSKKLAITNLNRHMASYYFDLYGLIAPGDEVSYTDYDVRIYLSEKEQEFADLLLYNLGLNENARVVCVFPGGGASWGRERHKKLWQGEKFLELILKILLLDSSIYVFVMGDESDKETMQLPIELQRTRRAFDFRGRLTIRETVSVLKLAVLSITNDGGPAHLSAAAGTEVISIMGPVPEDVYRPLGDPAKIRIVTSEVDCRPCYRNFRMPECSRDYACIKDITVDRVLKEVKAVLHT